MATPSLSLSCPFCSLSFPSYEALMQHIWLHHPEIEDSNAKSCDIEKDTNMPLTDVFTSTGTVRLSDRSAQRQYMECECGETIALSDFDNHRDLHLAECTGAEESGISLSDLDTVIGVDSPSKIHHSLKQKYQAHSGNTPKQKTDQGIARVRSDRLLKEMGPEHHDLSSINIPTNLKNGKADFRSSRHLNRSGRITGRRSSSKSWIDAFIRKEVNEKESLSKAREPSQIGLRRLGKKELGPFAFEERMPGWLEKKLEEGAKVQVINQITSNGQNVCIELIANETRGILPVLAQLCKQDPKVYKFYLCNPEVQHVAKLEREGGFCGYRNIQMLLSYIQATKSEGHELFPGRLPSIFSLQDLIEDAWDRGFHPEGRIETGGIRRTRKFIGTLEAQALLNGHGIGVSDHAYETSSNPGLLMDFLQDVEDYFRSELDEHQRDQRMCLTNLPPIYFQHPGHSLTIVGFEERVSGRCNLLVFDPMYKTSPGVKRLLCSRFRVKRPETLLKAYRRGPDYLKRHDNFELLLLNSRAPPGTGWSNPTKAK